MTAATVPVNGGCVVVVVGATVVVVDGGDVVVGVLVATGALPRPARCAELGAAVPPQEVAASPRTSAERTDDTMAGPEPPDSGGRDTADDPTGAPGGPGIARPGLLGTPLRRGMAVVVTV
ncbi:MAG TPA: hypothetical protein VMU09_03245, partial [Acidimicrobiales bacterium]|nr:hypothetical protein [Acidimicrobiales bacterium]